jgi:hypothetical protein
MRERLRMSLTASFNEYQYGSLAGAAPMLPGRGIEGTMPVMMIGSDESFVDLDIAFERLGHRLTLHCKANPMGHEPCRTIRSESEIPHKL